MDLTRLFAELYDGMPAEPFLSGEARLGLERADREARTIARTILNGTYAAGEVAERMDDLGWAERLAHLLALDRAFAGAHPFLAGFRAVSPELAEIRDRYIEEGVLGADGVPGQLLPRLGAPGAARLRLETVADALRFVVRVPEAEMRAIRLLWVGNTFADGDAISRRELRIACAPMIESYEELVLEKSGPPKARAYRISPRGDVVRGRIQALVRELDDSGAVIGFLPESTLDDEILAAWREELTNAKPPPDSRLRWIVCGTGPVGAVAGKSPPNRAVVLDRLNPAEPVWTQDKRHRFTIEPPGLEEWRLQPHLGKVQTTEDIHLGDHTVIVESALGRIAITVCEDLARLTRMKGPLEACGVSLVLAPVFSKEIRQHFWEDAAGKFYVGDGAAIVVCNSRAVAVARELEVDDDDGDGPGWGTALARWPESFALACSEGPADVRVLRFPIRVPPEPD